MGCFSFLCKKSGNAALSTSFDGSPCYLFLLKDGKVIEEMYGNYDSYGRVFSGGQREDVHHELQNSFEWSMEWSSVCRLMFDGHNYGNGIAVILAEYYDGVHPTTRSEDDPNQGWGNCEEDGDLMGDCSSNKFPKVENPYHKIY